MKDFSFNYRQGYRRRNLAGQGRKAIFAAVAEQLVKEDMGFTLEAMKMPLEVLGCEIDQRFPVLGIPEKGKVAG